MALFLCAFSMLHFGCEARPKPNPSSPTAAKTPTPSKATPPALRDHSEVVAKLRQEIETLKGNDAGRIRTRQGLVQALCAAGDISAIQSELTLLMDDAEQCSGPQVAEDVAVNVAIAARRKKSPRSAEIVLRQTLKRFPASKDAVRMWIQIGECQLAQNHYRQAEETFRQLVENHDEHPGASWAWRRLALAQTLQSQFDEALATLDIMAGKYNAHDAGEYAESRKPYVLNLAGRKAEAKRAYQDFLANNEVSAYRELATSQLKALDVETRLAGIQP